jgi:hypothetical protein
VSGTLSSTLLYNAATKKWDSSPSTTPGPLRTQGMAFNGTTAVMFGGTSGTVQNETWL